MEVSASGCPSYPDSLGRLRGASEESLALFSRRFSSASLSSPRLEERGVAGALKTWR